LAQVQTFDGLELTVHLAQIDGVHWATFDALAIEPAARRAVDETESADASASPPETEVPAATADPASAETAAATTEDVAEGGEDAESEEAEGVEEVSLEEADESVDPAELGRRLGKWAYQIPEHLYNRLTTGRSEFVGDRDSTS
jgi:hypothetical protein